MKAQKYLKSRVEEFNITNLLTNMKKGIEKIGIVALIAAIIGVSSYGFKKEATGKDAWPIDSVTGEQKSKEPIKIAFVSTKDDEAGEIYIMNSDGSETKRLTNNPAMDAPACWSPDVKKIVFISSRNGEKKTETKKTDIGVTVMVTFGNIDIFIMNPDGSEKQNLTNNPARDFAPCWSGDGKKIVFVSDRDGNQEIYTMNPDGTGPQRLTNDPGADSSPVWSADNKKIAFVSNREGNTEIYVMNADGSEQKNLTNNPGSDSSPSWSPDGKKITFNSDRDGNREIYVMNPDGSRQQNLTNNPARDWRYRWSPDSQKISFETDRDGDSDIYIMNADGSEPKNLTHNLARDRYHCWSPDGKKIAFISGTARVGSWDIYIMNTDGSEKKRLTSGFDTSRGTPVWSPLLSNVIKVKHINKGNKI